MLKVTTIIKPMKVGMNRPFLVECSDQQQYVMKCRNDEPASDKVLFNELIGSRVARLLGLPTPDFTVARLSRDMIDRDRDLYALRFIDGPVFVSKLLPGTSMMNAFIFDQAQNPEDFGGIIFFDQLLMNTDRGYNPGNWFYDKHTRSLVVIDSSNIFRLASIWDAISLDQDTKLPPVLLKELDEPGYQYLKQIMLKKIEHPFDKIRYAANKITPAAIEAIFEDIPEDWRISERDQQAAKSFVKFQFAHTEDIVQQLENKFKQSRKEARS